jgi:hypothetical protein
MKACMKTTLPTRPIERLALRQRETLWLAFGIATGALFSRAEANELFFNAGRRIGTIVTKNLSYNAPSSGANLLSNRAHGNAPPFVNVAGHVFPLSN